MGDEEPATKADLNNLMTWMDAMMVVMESQKSQLDAWYVSNVSIIFDAPCLFLHHLLSVSLHFVAFLCIFRN
jgi:hypothetical protein